MPLSEIEEIEYLELLEAEDRERVSDKLEEVKTTDKPIVIVQGGRGAGAKSWGFASLVVQLCQYEYHRCACLREVQLSLTESVYQLIMDTIHRLGYSKDWNITRERITNIKTSSFIIFRGLRNLMAARQIKGLEGIDLVWCDEAATIIDESWSALMPTFVRNDGWRLFISYNPETEFDPCTVRFWNSDRKDVLKIRVEPGKKDNPWWNEGLQNEMDELYKVDADEAEHVYGGQARKQGQNAVMSRVRIRAAMMREIEAVGAVEIGVDVARFGDDQTVMYKRHGLKTIERRSFLGQDTMRTADEAWDMAGRDPQVRIKVDDTGVGGGVSDRLNQLGAQVVRIDFGSSPADTNKYTTAADEMWFEFPVDEAQIPNNQELMQQLAGRRYEYDNASRKKIESKKDYKKRLKKSPDDADALLLCYYKGGITMFDKSIRDGMAKRRQQR
jgi:phage terminase large subunit